MAAYPELTAQDLSSFTGRPAASYPATSVTTALAQARLLFKMSTCLANLPDDEDELSLARYAILSYADFIVLTLPFAKAIASPFSSESLGSYSYSKAAAAAAKGEKTGLMWFDLAVDRLGVCGDTDGIAEFGGIEMFENDGEFVAGSSGANVRFLSPADIDASAEFGHVISSN